MQLDLLRSPHDHERSNVDFALSRHLIHFLMRVDKANTIVSKALLCLFKHGSYCKTVLRPFVTSNAKWLILVKSEDM